ncbi:DinB family protein [Chloroflexi bacterium TSY]|nr:DinB family protein [Chloroflexi bacterium TSY]
MSSNSAVKLLRAQYKGAHDVLEGTMKGVTSEQAHWIPAGTANPLGATYAHILVSEDGLFNGALQGGAPLMASSWADKTGLSEPAPQGNQWGEWGRRVKVDLDAARAYGQAVYAATDKYFATLTDEDLGREVDLTGIGLGKYTLGQISSILLNNVTWHTGEISCLKGLQGGKGYQF